jgi:hypothetical protein
MEIEHLIRYAPRAVGLKPSAMQGEARLRGQERNNYSKTISPHARSRARRRTMADGFSPTATHGGRRMGSASVTALVQGGSTSMRTAIICFTPRVVGCDIRSCNLSGAGQFVLASRTPQAAPGMHSPGIRRGWQRWRQR